MESTLSKAEVAQISVTNSTELNKLIAGSGQWSPLFGDVPDKVLFTNITPIKSSREWEGNTYWSMKTKDNEGIESQDISIVKGSEDKSLLNIGVFFAIRDHVGVKNSFTKGVTFRIFAY